MKKVKHLVSYDEWRLIIYALNKMRNGLIAEGKYTDTVDVALMTVISAKTKTAKTGQKNRIHRVAACFFP